MKISPHSGFLMPLLVLFLCACYYDKEEILYPETRCTSIDNPSFSADILPLLNARCNNCHAGVSPSAGIRLDAFDDVVKSVNDGSLMGSIQHLSPYSAMPKNGDKLNACDIQKIEAWITAGPNNN